MRKSNWKQKDDIGKFIVGILLVSVWTIVIYCCSYLEACRP